MKILIKENGFYDEKKKKKSKKVDENIKYCFYFQIAPLTSNDATCSKLS